MKKIVFYFFCMFLSVGLNASDSTVVKLNMEKAGFISKWDELYIKLTVKNISKNPLLITHYESWGVIEDSIGLFCVQVQRKETKLYIDLPARGSIDNLVFTDEYDTIKYNGIKSFSFHLGTTFDLKPGNYRVRVFCFFSAINKRKDVVTSWHYFTIKNLIKRQD